MKEKNKTYTAADFARYYAGTMPADEMHELEKAALEDPFLEDALEGYVHAPAAESDIAELQVRLAEKRKKKNIFFISSFAQNKWWRIAALLIIIAGAGYLFYRANYASNENSLAKNEIKTSTLKEDSTAHVKEDATTTKGVLAFENQRASKLAQKAKTVLPLAKGRIEKEFVPAYKTHREIASNYSADKPAYSFSSDSIRFRNSNKAIGLRAATGYLLKGKVTDENGNAVPYASITDKTRNKTTVTDTAGRFLFQSKDSIVTALISAEGYDTKTFKIKKDVQPAIAMNKTTAELNEVAINGYSSERKQLKKSTPALKELKGTDAGVQITPVIPQPFEGLEKYDEYLEENTVPVYNENNERLTGEVLLSFTINKKGRPKNIKVVKSTCEACEKNAINLLKKGPAWSGKKDTPATVVVKF